MYLKNSNFAIYLGLAVLLGFGASALYFSNADSSMLSGDISKASRFSQMKEDPETTAIEEKLQNDKEYYNETKETFSFISKRVDDLQELTSETIQLCANIPEFKDAIKTVVSLNAKAYNTQQTLLVVNNGLEKLGAKKSAPEYEQAVNNVYVGYNKIEYQLSIGKTFVNVASDYLKGKDGEEYAPIADLVTKWTEYCMQDAILNDSEENIQYWDEAGNNAAASSAAIAKAFQKSFSNAALALEGKDKLNLDGKQRINLEDKQRINLEDKARINLEDKQRINLEDKARINLEDKQRINLEDKQRINLEDKQRINLDNKQRINLDNKQRVN